MNELKVRISVPTLPPAYTCDGEGKLPALEIHGIDNSVSKSLALIMNDLLALGEKGFVHWLIWNVELVSVLPEKIPKTTAVTFPISALQGLNRFGTIEYAGPCPPMGHKHRYDFKVFGIDTNLNLAAVPG
ncbi:MAG: YbhB/YbcL family Raf kinase inhibitor-like protein [Methanomicrobiales archaeon]